MVLLNMKLKRRKNISPGPGYSGYFLYISILVFCLCGCVGSHAEHGSEPALSGSSGDMQLKRAATGSSHLIANRIGNAVARNLSGGGGDGDKDEPSKEIDSGITPLEFGKTADSGTSDQAMIAKKVTPLNAIGSTRDDDRGLIDLQARRARGVRVCYAAPVFKLLPDDKRGRQHQRFLFKLANGTTVLVAHNIDLAARVPLQQGNLVEVCGEYIWNDKGGVIHYTHRATSRFKQGGYIKFNGDLYQ